LPAFAENPRFLESGRIALQVPLLSGLKRVLGAKIVSESWQGGPGHCLQRCMSMRGDTAEVDSTLRRPQASKPIRAVAFIRPDRIRQHVSHLFPAVANHGFDSLPK
jgi:hypothetical protein